ncbi:MSC_0621 family F1-like ATPase epsilon subunit [[Mycoplasma] testudinis]|uniref:MSC_0621 family F1-like ATPase epsilon subunit n=1 Tax=[Mycoplasma] testudinis TaxID=33924 RepID=UPI0004859B54|nr:hypothetical protein [[Mycoplasma] testudinis]
MDKLNTNTFQLLKVNLIKNDGKTKIWSANSVFVYNDLEQVWDELDDNVLVKSENFFVRFDRHSKRSRYLLLSKSLLKKQGNEINLYLNEPLVVYYQDYLNIQAKNPIEKIKQLKTKIQELKQAQDWGLGIADQIELELAMIELKKYELMMQFSLVARETD